MNKKILTLLSTGLLCLSAGLAFADRYAPGDGYDPTSPSEPSMRYLLETEASPSYAGYTSLSGSTFAEGTGIYLYAQPNSNYFFKGWYDGDSLISTVNNLDFVMPAHAVKLTAKFGYLPENPGDPMEDGYTHTVRVNCDPNNGGDVSTGRYFLMREGESTYIYAYPNNGFRFSGWKVNGVNIAPNDDGSLKNPLRINMEDKNLDILASFSYDPSSPADPFPNSFNRETNELIVDNFEPGNLQGTIEELISDRRYNIGRPEVYSILIIGKMDDSDRYFGWGMSECTKVDLGRTTGLEYIEYNTFWDMNALSEVILPASLSYIDSYTFINNPYLSSITCYAPVPPECWDEFFYGFSYPDDNIASGVVAYVPASSLALYKEKPGWRHLSLKPIESADCRIYVNLPADYADGRYKGMQIVLENPASGQTQRYVVNDRPTYLFENLIMNVEGLNLYYNVHLRNQDGDIIASYNNILLTNEEPEFTVDFTDVKGVNDLNLAVLQSDGKNVAGDLEIVWKNTEGGYVASGSKAAGVLEGKVLNVIVTLPDSYGVQYEVPGIKQFVSGVNNADTIRLVEYPRVMAIGQMTSDYDGEPIPRGYVTVEQTLAGKYRHTGTGVTGVDGKYSVEYISHEAAPGKVTARADGFMTQPVEILNFTEWDEMKNFVMKSIYGAIIEVNLSWLAPGEEKASEYKDFSNVDFSLFNNTTNRKIQNFINQAPKLVVPDEAVGGDKVLVTVSSRSGVFDDVTAELSLDSDGKGAVNIEVKEHGKITSTYSTAEAANVSAMLYDGDGKLVKHKLFDSKKSVSFPNLNSGNYTLVAFNDSPYFTGFSSLDDLVAFEGFEKDKDYLMENMEVKDGEIASISFSDVPSFDESQFYKTDPSLTLLKVNKTKVTASNYVTLSTRFQFQPEYRGYEQHVKLVFEFPEHVEYVKNSVVNGDETGNLTAEGKRKYSLENVTPGTTVRFCVMPEKGGEYYPTATLEYDLHGSHYTQPLGSFYFQGVDFQLFVPKRTSRKSIWARGVATNGGDVTVFVNGAPLSSAKASGNGDWLAEVPLLDQENSRLQQIYGEIVSSKGTFPTESAVVEYDKDYPELDYVRMIHNGSVVDFNHAKAKTSVKSYSYNPDRDMFTLNAKFLENKENIESVTFHILSSDGSEREIEAVYSSGNDAYIAALGYPDSFRLPVNVTVDYTYKRRDGSKSDFYMDFIAPDVEPIIDPSGFVFEAEESNRVEGATVTVFYREAVEDQFGVEWQTVKWDATAYGQENPLLTDKEGFYGWDVPAGEWQVKYEKQGYETKFSKWLQVPPPQLDVNIGLIRNDAPYVKAYHAYDGDKGIEITFDHYMDISSLEGNIYIQREDAVPGADDELISGDIIVINNNPEAESAKYFNTVRFIPEEPISSTTNEVYLIVAKAAKSYSGVEMMEPFKQSVTIEKEITGLAADEGNIEVEEGNKLAVVISATPAEAAINKTLIVSNQSPLVLSISEDSEIEVLEDGSLSMELDKNGQATIELNGLMAGQSELELAIKDSNVKGKALVDVVAVVTKLSRPSSSLPDRSSVYRGMLAELSSKYPNGVIYYTINGEDPTPETGIRYEGAILIDKDMIVKAIVVDNNKVSEVAEFNYSLKTGLMDLSLNQGWSWISHNMESAVKAEDIYREDIYRILSQTEELINDPQYGGFVGNLQELAPHKSYKVESKKAGKVTLSDVAYNPDQAISLNKGWNWIGYPIDQVLELDEAFANTDCDDGDVIETIGGGSAEYKDGRWIGNLVNHGMKPGIGYLYYSVRDKEIRYNTSLVSTAAARLAVMPAVATAWAADKYLYPSLMPIVADVINEDGSIAEPGVYQVGAFCGSECRGVGEYVEGYLFLTVHGKVGDQISFRILSAAEDAELVLKETIDFTEDPVGSLDSPYRLNTQTTNVTELIDNNNDVTVNVRNRQLFVNGTDVNYVAVYDVAGNKILATTHVESPISLEILSSGVHVVAVQHAGEWSYHKVMVK